MQGNAIIGPVVDDVGKVGLGGDRAIIASAFYTARPLQEIEVNASRLDLLLRLDLASPDEWIRGCIAPDALLDFINRHTDKGVDVRLRVARHAHAKVYWGDRAFLVGSANLTTRALGGSGLEVLWREERDAARKRMSQALRQYADGLAVCTIAELQDFVARHQAAVTAAQAARKPAGVDHEDEKRLPRLKAKRPARLGDYEAFLAWLARRPEDAAAETLARAHGKGNLQGHIHRNYYGLRQFLIARPSLRRRFATVDPDTYKLSADPATEAAMADFVTNEANDEPDFELRIWKTYLPKECGGRAGKHGGTIGNLNRMLPLVAQFVAAKLR